MTRIVVDSEAGPHKNHTVVFLGSEKGIILKFLAKMNNGFLNDSLFLEELNVYNPDKYVAFNSVAFISSTKAPRDCIALAVNGRGLDSRRKTLGYSCYKQRKVTNSMCVSERMCAFV